jgi:putative flippase GtrA
MSGVTRLAVVYALIAAIATLANVGCQALSIALYHGPYRIAVSVLIGTAAGLPIKYLLEKRHVFGFETKSLTQDSRLFIVYSFFGVFTTAVFWITEYVFHIAFGTDLLRYVGAVMGLTLGTILRYQLDKRFVFVTGPGPVGLAS